MKRLTPTLALSALIVALLVWFFWPTPAATRTTPPAPAAAPDVTRAILPAPTAPDPAKLPAPPGERSTLADEFNSPKTDIRADLRTVSAILATFRTNFPRDGNPVGTNSEITAVLTGKNKLRLALIPPDHPAINQDGELVDRWGTPFFFHAESGTKMTIESAGPDKKRHTADDQVFTP